MVSYMVPKLSSNSLEVQLMFTRFSQITQLNGGTNIRPPTILADMVLRSYKVLPHQPVNQHDLLFHANCLQFDLGMTYNFVKQTPAKGFTDNLRITLKNLMINTLNPWDPLRMCEEVMNWRSSFITQFDQRIPPDMPHCPIPLSSWSLLLSRAARAQNLPEIAYQYIMSQPPDSSTRYDSFETWAEKVWVSLDLNTLDGQMFKEPEVSQLENLKDSQLETFNYLKGLYFQKNRNISEAINCFNRASKGIKVWESFSSIFYQRWKEHGESNDANQCIKSCIRQLCQSSDVTKPMMRLLHIVLFSFDNQTVSTSALSSLPQVPTLHWIHYLPVLLSRPTETQMYLFNHVLRSIILEFPQIIFYPLYTLCQSLGMPTDNPYYRPTTPFHGAVVEPTVPFVRSPHSQSAQLAMAGRASDKTVPINVFDCHSPHSQTIFFFWIIILSHYPHVSQLLLFLDTLYSLPRDPYRELLASIDRVLSSAYSEVASSGPSALSRPVSDPIKQRLDSVILATFSSKWAVPSTFAFIEQYEKPFLSDFASSIVISEGPVPNASFPSSLQELVQRLLLWKDFLRSEIQRDRPNPNAFFGCKFLPNVLEVPGKFLSYNNFYRSLPTVQSIAPVQPRLYLDRHGLRYFSLTDERSCEARFYLEQVNGIELILEERVLAQQIYFEKICFASPPIQSRHLHAPLPCYVNIGPTLRLVRSDASMVSFEGVYQSVLQGKFDKEQLTFALRLFFANHSELPPSDAMKPLIAAVPREKLLSSVIPSDTLTSFVYRAVLLEFIARFDRLASISDFYVFRSEFARHYGYSQFIQYLFAFVSLSVRSLAGLR